MDQAGRYAEPRRRRLERSEQLPRSRYANGQARKALGLAVDLEKSWCEPPEPGGPGDKPPPWRLVGAVVDVHRSPFFSAGCDGQNCPCCRNCSFRLRVALELPRMRWLKARSRRLHPSRVCRSPVLAGGASFLEIVSGRSGRSDPPLLRSSSARGPRSKLGLVAGRLWAGDAPEATMCTGPVSTQLGPVAR